MEQFTDLISSYFDEVKNMITSPLFSFGNNEVSVGTILYFLFTFFVLFFVAARIRHIVTDKLLANASMEQGLKVSIGNVVRFLFLLIGSFVIIQTAGIDLSTLNLLAGALGVGIGFGLQNITDNFISGIIILIEKPIKVGDRIDVSGVNGDVLSISIRSTTILTNDNISIIVPNSEFISSQVINWSHNDRNIRFRYPVGVSYNEDPEHIKKILLQVAIDNPNVLEEPAPNVFFDDFGDSSLNFELGVWTSSHINKPGILKSELYFEIFKRFKEEGVEIPFPQRDLHIKSSAIHKAPTLPMPS